MAYGPYGARGAASAYNPRTGTSAATRQGSNVYGSWGATGVQRGDDWATTARRTNNVTDTTTRTTRTSEGGAAVSRSGDNGRTTVGRTGSGDVYAGHDGNVYRKQGDSWQQYGEGGWSGVEQPTPQQRQQAQDRAAQAGAQAGNRAAGSSWDQATAGQVNRDSAARAEGAQRTRDSSSVRSGASHEARQLSRERRSASGWGRATPLRRARRSATRRCATLVLLLMPVCASAQELEPGAYWPIPKGINIVTVVNNLNWGDLAFDPAAPIDEASATINTTAFVFTGTFSLAGRSANAGVVLPVVGGHLEGLYLGEFAEAGRFGLGDPRVRLAMNLYGAPAMTPQEFASYRQRGIVGISVTVAPPLGQYDSTKLINLGTNRWSFRPELGVSRTFGQWVVELMAGVWLFTDNAEFVGGRTREQDPIGATQIHVTYKFKPTTWLAANANYFTGGRTTIGGTAERRSPAQFTNRRDVFLGARSRPFDPDCGEPRGLHNDRRRLHLDRGQLQLRVDALKGHKGHNDEIHTHPLRDSAWSRRPPRHALVRRRPHRRPRQPRRRRHRPRLTSPSRKRRRRTTPFRKTCVLSMDKPFTGDFDEMRQAPLHSRGRDLQPHALLHRQGAGARGDVRGLEALREGAERRT